MVKPKIKPIGEAPNLQIRKDTFGVSEQDTIISYGDAVYCPADGMSSDLLVHELKHCERQGWTENSARRWWERYMESKDFRLEEERIAYQAQYNFCKTVYSDRNKLNAIRIALAKELASPRYGNLVTQSEALELIQK